MKSAVEIIQFVEQFCDNITGRPEVFGSHESNEMELLALLTVREFALSPAAAQITHSTWRKLCVELKCGNTGLTHGQDRMPHESEEEHKQRIYRSFGTLVRRVIEAQGPIPDLALLAEEAT